MAVIDRNAMELLYIVRDNYPKTYEWVKHKASWEGMPVGAVCMAYCDYIKKMMAEERGECYASD